MRVAVVSLRFAPGHIAHLRAYRELFSSLGCEVKLFVANGYKPFLGEDDSIVFSDDYSAIVDWKPESVLSYNIAEKNIGLAKQCAKKGILFFYVLHEPWVSFREFFGERERMPRRAAANIVNYLTCKLAYKVVLASENGRVKYERYMGTCNKRYGVFPLIFCDDYDPQITYKREYFSFIGGFTDSRGSTAFMDFAKYALTNHHPIKFCVATRTSISIDDDFLKREVAEGRLLIQSGRPLSSQEINSFYRQSICVWNAYKNSTQSGVLANALMQGAPVLVTDRGDTSSVIENNVEGCYITIPYNNEEIEQAYSYISSHVDEMSEAARKTFHEKYEYAVFLDRAKEVYEIG